VKNGSDSDDLSPPEELRELVGYPGTGRDLETALQSAWEEAKASGHRVFRVQDIYVFGENPISGYHVIITPGG